MLLELMKMDLEVIMQKMASLNSEMNIDYSIQYA